MQKKYIYSAVVIGLCLFISFGVYKGQQTEAAAQKDRVTKGDKAPEIAQPNPQGKELKLSDLKGSIVLIDFWASWCRPCLAKLPKLKKLYKEFKDKNYAEADSFTVFSVSLDKRKGRWKKAIKKFDLNWKYHVSDLNGWKAEPASKYGVKRIPMTFLIGPDGKVIGRNWHFDDVKWELEKRLEE